MRLPVVSGSPKRAESEAALPALSQTIARALMPTAGIRRPELLDQRHCYRYDAETRLAVLADTAAARKRMRRPAAARCERENRTGSSRKTLA